MSHTSRTGQLHKSKLYRCGQPWTSIKLPDQSFGHVSPSEMGRSTRRRPRVRGLSPCFFHGDCASVVSHPCLLTAAGRSGTAPVLQSVVYSLACVVLHSNPRVDSFDGWGRGCCGDVYSVDPLLAEAPEIRVSTASRF